nr:putative uncharacterized protein DDB_G0283051 [Bactrocera oleae]
MKKKPTKATTKNCYFLLLTTKSSRNLFTNYDSDDFTSLNSSSEYNHNDIHNNSNNSNSKQAKINYNNNNKPAMQYSKSDYDVFNSSFVSSSDFFIYPNNNNRNNNINKSQQDGPYQL